MNLPFDPDHLPAAADPAVPAGLRAEFLRHETRRQFLGQLGRGLGGAALAALAGNPLSAAAAAAPKARRAIYLFMAGAPSQLDLWDYKPGLGARYDQDLPESVRGGQTLTGMTSTQSRLPIAPSIYRFNQHGHCRRWVSELLPHTAGLVDDIAVVKSVWTEAINHDPAITYMLTGNQVAGKPSVGAWLSYGLGRMNEDLPTFVVLTSKFSSTSGAQALFSRLWAAGMLPAEHGGVAFRGDGDPVLYLNDPTRLDTATRRALLDGVQALNRRTYEEIGDPETHARMAHYEMAFRMQASVPELTDLSRETAETFELYGPESRTPGTFAYNCLLARRLAERGVRFTQIFHRGWDQHKALPANLPLQCRDVDRGCHALVTDLKRRGLLDDTLVVWGGEFGRTVYSQGELTPKNYGRDHHPKCFTVWLAGGGVRPGIEYGETDEYGYNIVRDPMHLRDLNATMLHLFGLDHERLAVRHQGLDHRLTGVLPARVVREILA